jgi:hypothetical protein
MSGELYHAIQRLSTTRAEEIHLRLAWLPGRKYALLITDHCHRKHRFSLSGFTLGSGATSVDGNRFNA